jgi:hypothetical protein
MPVSELLELPVELSAASVDDESLGSSAASG